MNEKTNNGTHLPEIQLKTYHNNEFEYIRGQK